MTGIALAGALLSVPSASAVNIGDEGCTPGFWKNHPTIWEEYTPATTVGSVWNFGAAPAEVAAYANTTFLDALEAGGGSGLEGATKILMRASVAAYLNAAHEGVGYPFRRLTAPPEPGGMQPLIDAALASGDRDQMLALATLLDNTNNLGSPFCD